VLDTGCTWRQLEPVDPKGFNLKLTTHKLDRATGTSTIHFRDVQNRVAHALNATVSSLISHKDPRALAAIFLGGALGALARVGLTQLFPANDGAFPYAIFAINVVGAFILAYAVTYLQRRHSDPTIPRAFIGIGFCGAFTTFSTMQLQLFEMLKLHDYGTAVAYIAASLVVGYAAVLAAVTLGKTRVQT